LNVVVGFLENAKTGKVVRLHIAGNVVNKRNI